MTKGLLIAITIAVTACAPPPPQRWVRQGTPGQEFELTAQGCLAKLKKEFNPHEDYCSPIRRCATSEALLARRMAWERQFGWCMEERGYVRAIGAADPSDEVLEYSPPYPYRAP